MMSNKYYYCFVCFAAALSLALPGCDSGPVDPNLDPNSIVLPGTYTTCDTAFAMADGQSYTFRLDDVYCLSYTDFAGQTVRLKFDFLSGLTCTIQINDEPEQPLSPGQIIQHELGFSGKCCVTLSLASEPAGDMNVTVNPTDTSGNPLGVGSITALAQTGLPADDSEPSANPGQTITISGSGFESTSKVTFPKIDDAGQPAQVQVALASVAEDGGSGTVVVPTTAVTGYVTLPNQASVYLQIVPKITGIAGGTPGMVATISGLGFVEGATTVRFGADDVTVADGGTAADDGIDVQGGNSKVLVTVPSSGALPYEVITAGGRTGRSGDLTGTSATAQFGEPTDPNTASANAKQVITLTGTGFDVNTKVNFHIINDAGAESVATVAPASVAEDGLSLTVMVPANAKTGKLGLLSGRDGATLQVVPTVTAIAGGTPGQQVTISGSGFVEGGTAVRFGSDSVMIQDGGKQADDGIDVQTTNTKVIVNVPANGTLPYEVITAGGRSSKSGQSIGLTAACIHGTPTDPNQASANTKQVITVTGVDFNDETRVTFPCIDIEGYPLVRTVIPASVADSGQSLTVIVPGDAYTGQVSLLYARTGCLLQIVPNVTGISGGTPGQQVTISGGGFIEGATSVRFGSDATKIVDGGVETDDGIDVQTSNAKLVVSVPQGGTLPYEVVTSGGRSTRTGRFTSVSAVATKGSPTDPNEASANPDQVITLYGSGFNDDARILFPSIDQYGQHWLEVIVPSSVAADGKSLTVRVPKEADTGQFSLLDSQEKYLLQVVPRITGVNYGVSDNVLVAGEGIHVKMTGLGFIEGQTAVYFGEQACSTTDTGLATGDEIEVQGDNTTLYVREPLDGTVPYWVVTPGGSTAGPARMTGITAVAIEGTPTDAAYPSANAGQTITVVGEHLSVLDRLVIMVVNDEGAWMPLVVEPVAYAADETALTIKLPFNIGTGYVGLLGGADRFYLQIVPHITAFAAPSDSLPYGRYSGTGFIQGGMTAHVGGTVFPAGLIDVTGGNKAFSILDTYETNQATYVETAGGTSETFTP